MYLSLSLNEEKEINIHNFIWLIEEFWNTVWQSIDIFNFIEQARK